MVRRGSLPVLCVCALLLMGSGRRGGWNGEPARPGQIIENFDDGQVQLLSYPGEDEQPSGWTLDSLITHNNSPFSLKLSGNTWKLEAIAPVALDSGDVWQVAAYVAQAGELQGFGVVDSVHALFFSFAGSEEALTDLWVTVDQGAFPLSVWKEYRLAVADEWLTRYGYLPTITGIVFANDHETDPTSVVYFDDVIDVTADLPSPPQVSITYSIGPLYRDALGRRSVDVQFFSHVTDPDSGTHSYLWRFGDDSTSTAANPHHTFLVVDDHPYTVLLEVVDSTGLWGRASCSISVDPGPTSFPITMNFVGDVMMARSYEAPGGIIPTRGVQAIFAPTLPFLGNAADITVANLESALTQSGTRHPTKPIVFRSSPANVAGLVYAGIDVVSIANNHILDYGLPGLQENRSVLQQHGVAFSGAGANACEASLPVFLSRSGRTFAFLGFSDRTGQYNNEQPYLNAGENKPGFSNLTPFELVRQINAARSSADLIVVEMHSGTEYGTAPQIPDGTVEGEAALEGDEDYSSSFTAPLATDREIRRLAIDAGADVVICHHPHIIQGFEVYRGKLIAHSLGNFAFDLAYTETFPSGILNAKVNGSGIYEYSVTPAYIDHYIPVRAQGEFGLYILDHLAMLSKALGTYLVVNRDSCTAGIVLDTLALQPHITSTERTLPLHQSGGAWVSAPSRFPRNGSVSAVRSVMPPGSFDYRLGREVLWMGNFEDEGCRLWAPAGSDAGYDSITFHAGRRSLRHQRSAASGLLTTGLEKRLRTSPAQIPFSVCGWVKTDNAHAATMKVKFYSSRSGSAELGTGDLGTLVEGTTGWLYYSNDFDAPTGTAFIDLLLQTDAPVSGTGYSWFDDAGVIEWTPWQPVNGAGAIPCPNDYYWLQIRTSSPMTNATVTYEETDYGDSHPPVQVSVPIAEGWNLIANPVLRPDSLNRVRTLYPHSSFDYAFSFASGSGYVQSFVLNRGAGYWAKFPAAETQPISGTPVLSDSVAVSRGWNLIGSISVPVDTGALRTIPSGLAISPVYGYSQGYFPVERLQPGGAYWIKCRDSGRIALEGSPLPASLQPVNVPPRAKDWNPLTFTDASGVSQTLFFGAGEGLPAPVTFYELPPRPPSGSLDVRYASGCLIAWAGPQKSESQPVTVADARYPLHVAWEIRSPGTRAVLRIGEQEIALRANGSAVVAHRGIPVMLTIAGREEIPGDFELAQNYPNPFNPSTRISYALPVRTRASLRLYNTAGQLVRVLVDSEQPAGRYSVQWDGLNDSGARVSTGVYFYELRAGKFLQTRKLLLVK